MIGGSQTKRTHTDLSGGGFEDIGFICAACAMSQEMEKVKNRKELLRQAYPEPRNTFSHRLATLTLRLTSNVKYV